jgi:hypothetical protein
MPLDRGSIKKGMLLHGGECPGMMTKDRPPVRYGQPPPEPDFSEIEARLTEARRRLEEIAAAVKASKR